ncbi:2OG-Fe(II) oxygenase [Cyanophage S-RIM12_RW_29_1109]|nr:2OG-Fe(II) oxygenase [Cyanophage S-RIM12 isolate RW_01_0310]AOO15223.1 2OG-Fe(II) oxygenase [Cyanophage S-RIM12_Np_14_0310]AOO15650.1 2OG-Fe(II) oxygenase [Cyanophage S-RIM12_Np_22_1112]AOO16291.1 2OG-Fe(II) oxygenase [Cyanophage S-RIM12_RW_04_0709]AOO16722.1 2OG-Fe(II) oxygenase [Cyanophage S-RIM12_RW_07_1112]AOO16937.1 2OG-Fe(II) oxygenase [Cyanophage S-RIM12_RW_14_0101]AOO17153.1 2OG-Fe(II) oxygenase [Cyanophage S-RIM12_RW_22_0110]AOO17368.1 2OG-Fe(II) oxygenase [Cyanophage S-RIM12_RW_
MAAKLVDYIKTYNGLVDEQFCKNVIETFSKSNGEYIDNNQRPSFTELNISRRFLDKDPNWIDIQNNLTKVFIDAVELYMDDLDSGPDFPEKYAFEEHRLKMYHPNGYDQFKDHVDVGDYKSARRFLVCFLYLNTVSEGGETSFPKLDYQIAPECAKILVFPATWQWRHAGLPTVSENKYIVGTYLHYV